MNPFVTFQVAVRALLRNKTRSLLTMLGVIIGVAAVIAMVAIGEGAKARVEQAFTSLGTNLVVVMPGTTTAGGAHGGFGSQPSLTWEDLRAIRAELSSVRYAAPLLRSAGQVISEEQNWGTGIIGTTPEYFAIRSWKASLGRLFDQAEVEAGTKVVVLGQVVAEKLFGPEVNPVGRFVRLKNVPFEVVGVLVPKGQSGMGQNADDAVYVPAAAFESRIEGGMRQFINGMIMLGASTQGDTERAVRDVTRLLRERHRIPPGGDNDFSVHNVTEMASAFQQSTETLTTLLASIAIVSLIVGGIGIMNIMLVSVTERTREIGVRMAVGAKPRHIRAQFLVEALVLSMIGGVIGMALGIGAASRIGSQFGWPVLVRPDIVMVAVGFSALVGVVFGLYPAHKASRLDPIEALRYE
ncbi:MAG: ABC transporter permease [Deltaproteobacteria bacterium]|nr:ABC transporter permease [Deltaproteobacteria bacterium]